MRRGRVVDEAEYHSPINTDRVQRRGQVPGQAMPDQAMPDQAVPDSARQAVPDSARLSQYTARLSQYTARLSQYGQIRLD